MLKVVASFKVVLIISSLLFAIKARNLPILEQLTVLRSMGRLLSVKNLPGTNTLAYSAIASVRNKIGSLLNFFLRQKCCGKIS
jgi:hypothetical protein